MGDVRTQEYGPDPLVGTTIDGRYRVREILGEGGMGMVYSATQRDLDREVAVKVMAPEAANQATAIRRFKREAKSVTRLGHPNIVDVYDVGRLPDGRPYLVMQRLMGRDLATVLDEDGPPPIARVVELLRGPASALDLMHDHGIVHRDIKPENLMIHRCANGEEIVKLLDFGLIDFTSRDLTRLTRDGMVLGTPHYVSPEGAMGRRVDGRADVYALAVVAFELITGNVPIDGLSAVNVLRRKTREEPPTLGSRGVLVSDEVERVMARGLARRRGDRYPRAGEMLEALARAVEDGSVLDPIAGLPPTEPEQMVPQWALDPPPEHAEPDVEDEPVDGPPMRAFPIVLGIVVALALALGLGALLAFDADDAPSEVARPTAGAAAPGAEPGPAAVAEIAEGVLIPPDVRPRDRPPDPAAPAPGRRRARRTAPAAPAPPNDPLAAPAPDRAAAERHTRAGTQALLEGLAPAAVDRFRAAILAAPDHAPAWRGLGLANQRLGRPAEARLAFERYLSIEPEARDAEAIRLRLARLGDR